MRQNPYLNELIETSFKIVQVEMKSPPYLERYSAICKSISRLESSDLPESIKDMILSEINDYIRYVCTNVVLGDW